MSSTKLHYIFDPLCGWCYAVAPLVKAAKQVIPIVLHGGGLMSGVRRQTITPAWRDYVGPQDRSIGKMTGQVFGEAYLLGLLEDESTVLDSDPPIAAILAAEQLNWAGLNMLERLHEAYYIQGRRMADETVLCDVASEVGLDNVAFAKAFHDLSGAHLDAHIADSRCLLAIVGGQGFPTFVLENDGILERLDHMPFIGKSEAWKAALMNFQTSSLTTTHAEVGCGPDGCIV